jgi:hypothetical protein
MFANNTDPSSRTSSVSKTMATPLIGLRERREWMAWAAPRSSSEHREHSEVRQLDQHHQSREKSAAPPGRFSAVARQRPQGLSRNR